MRLVSFSNSVTGATARRVKAKMKRIGTLVKRRPYVARLPNLHRRFVASRLPLKFNTAWTAKYLHLTGYLDFGNRARDIENALQMPPKKVQEAEMVSKGPLIYCLHEITYVYGDTLK